MKNVLLTIFVCLLGISPIFAFYYNAFETDPGDTTYWQFTMSGTGNTVSAAISSGAAHTGSKSLLITVVNGSGNSGQLIVNYERYNMSGGITGVSKDSVLSFWIYIPSDSATWGDYKDQGYLQDTGFYHNFQGGYHSEASLRAGWLNVIQPAGTTYSGLIYKIGLRMNDVGLAGGAGTYKIYMDDVVLNDQVVVPVELSGFEAIESKL